MLISGGKIYTILLFHWQWSNIVAEYATNWLSASDSPMILEYEKNKLFTFIKYACSALSTISIVLRFNTQVEYMVVD